MGVRLWAVAFDADNAPALARFWAAALEWSCTEEDGYWSVTGGDGTVQRLDFATVPNQKRSANWMHFDLSSRSLADQHATVERLLELGARHIDIGQGPDATHVVLADPEGNEFCVLAPGNNFVDYGGLLGSLTCDGSRTVGYFWSRVLGWPLVWDQDEETAIRSPEGGQFITFGGEPPRPDKTKNRVHMDLAPPRDGDQAAEVERLLELGATHADIGQGDVPWTVMTDPDGNEFCVLTPR
jgi:predicted enzyme related to lactoylglutathione lyase